MHIKPLIKTQKSPLTTFCKKNTTVSQMATGFHHGTLLVAKTAERQQAATNCNKQQPMHIVSGGLD
jgi:hypothetical protein